MRSITWKVAPATVLVCALVTAGAGPALAAGPQPPKPADKAASKALVKTLKAVGKSVDKVADKAGHTVGVVDTLWGDDSSRQGRQAQRADGTWDASADLGSLYSLTRSIGAQNAWARGATGKDVTVALVDTGVVGVPGLAGKDKVIDGPDLSFESQSAGTRYLDGFGHGTHLAGIIAGDDDGYDPKHPDSARFAGVAPEAQLLNMKVAAGDGGADVSQVIAAIDWAVEHRDDNGMNVRVINLSYGTASEQGWQVDPLARAVENAWKHNILVVVASGNDGLDAPSLLMPAVDPHVLAVGAVDHAGTEPTDDDVVAAFTNGGSDERVSDVLAPGKSVVSLRVPGGYADIAHPEGRVAGDTSARFFRGSGTSQAAAVVSGEAALLFSAEPKLTADQAKAVLMGTARPLSGSDPAQGAGVADISSALTVTKTKLPLLARGGSDEPYSTGQGSLEASRGGEYVVDPATGDALTGEVDAMGAPWNAAAWKSAEDKGASWSQGVWNSRTWAGTKWVDKRQVQPVTWTGLSWSGSPWADHTWSSDSFQSRSWRGNSWQSRSWRADSWSSRSWRDNGWSSRSWRGIY
jgi:serine protease AprX